MWYNPQLLIFLFVCIWKTKCILLHHRLENIIKLYDLHISSSEIELKRHEGYDERFPENVVENDSILLEIIKNIEKIRKIQYLESIIYFPDEIKIQVIKDLSKESDIRPMSIIKGSLFHNWELDGEFDN